MGAGTCYLPVLNWAKAACRGYLAKNWPVSSQYQFSYGCSCNAAKGIVTGLQHISDNNICMITTYLFFLLVCGKFLALPYLYFLFICCFFLSRKKL